MATTADSTAAGGPDQGTLIEQTGSFNWLVQANRFRARLWASTDALLVPNTRVYVVEYSPGQAVIIPTAVFESFNMPFNCKASTFAKTDIGF